MLFKIGILSTDWDKSQGPSVCDKLSWSGPTDSQLKRWAVGFKIFINSTDPQAPLRRGHVTITGLHSRGMFRENVLTDYQRGKRERERIAVSSCWSNKIPNKSDAGREGFVLTCDLKRYCPSGRRGWVIGESGCSHYIHGEEADREAADT